MHTPVSNVEVHAALTKAADRLKRRHTTASILRAFKVTKTIAAISP
jgi:hypothetical protein